MIKVKDLIKELQQYDEDLEVGVYIDTTSYGSYFLYENNYTMLVDYENKPSMIFILPSGVPME